MSSNPRKDRESLASAAQVSSRSPFSGARIISKQINDLSRRLNELESIDVLGTAPTVLGARNDPESALANLLTALEDLGIIVDSTTAT